ncbi:MAG: hypothetical protein V4510_03155 [bacterium]
MRLLAGLVLGCLLLLPPAQAALNGDHGFAYDIPYMADFSGGGNLTLLSGSLDATLAPAVAPMMFFNAGASVLSGLTKVCWTVPALECFEDAAGNIAISWQAGASPGIYFPDAVGGALHASHALILFANLDDMRFAGATFPLGPLMAASTVGGTFTVGAIPAIPNTPSQDLASDNAGGFVNLQAGVFTVSKPGQVQTFRAAHDAVTFQGNPVLAPISADVMVMPFAAGTIHMGTADAASAAQGLDLSRIQSMQSQVMEAIGQPGKSTDKPGLGALADIQSKILNGAVLTVPSQEGSTPSIKDVTLIRFDSLDATARTGTIATTGQSPLHIQAGRVQNAPGLVGFGFLQLPWWSYLLWALAIGALVTRFVLGDKAPKKNERWDRLKWIGWIVGPLAFLLFFFLWDNEVRAVWGVSLLSGPSGAGLLVVTLLELLPMGIVFFGVVTPLRILIRNGLRIGKQGSFMGLAGPTATLLGFLFGATLMLSYVDMVLRQIG